MGAKHTYVRPSSRGGNLGRVFGQRAGGSYIRDKTSTIRDFDRVARHCFAALCFFLLPKRKRKMGWGRSPPIHRPTRTGGEAQRKRLCSLRLPSLLPFLSYFFALVMHACSHACVHICLLVCQRPPDDRSGLGTWFFVMVDYWTTGRQTDARVFLETRHLTF